MYQIRDLLNIAVKGKASDLHIKPGMMPMFRVNGKLYPIKNGKVVTPEDTKRMAFGMMTQEQIKQFKERPEMDVAHSEDHIGRFRVNIFQQRGSVGMVIRSIPFDVPDLESLGLPEVIKNLCDKHRGLVLFTGATGSGKSTSLAAMIKKINQTRSGHILTIEDPIEYLIKDEKCIINQREIGLDTDSFSTALRASLRQDPDIILVGEMRDKETIETALVAAETGHLVFSTLHTLDAGETINRILTTFPPHQQKQIRLQLGSVLQAIISQRLVPTQDGKSRAPACEILINNSRIREMIENEDKTREISDAIAQGKTSFGMQTFDQSLMQLLTQGLISYDEAMRQSTNPDDFALKMKGVDSTGASKWDDFDGRAQDNSENKGDLPDDESMSFERF
ncbi:type IV pilus twitching motility protein PilT [bacterium]|nr:type IV pilus twitching motility protein PilT [bacterium]